MKIKEVEIEAFRAYRSKSDGIFDFTNDEGVPSDFVAIYAPNGFGKSSFYDAVEWAVTNNVERLCGEYNKSNNQSAAKSTKKPNEGQKILRNKYADENVATNVVVSTTRPNLFERKLPKIRKNQSDIRIGGRENDYFRRVILSQDEIDRFLREAKPQDRYTKFMDHLGSDIETTRKELSALINDNKTELSALNKKSKLLIKELKQPIDLSIFEKFNSVAVELNMMGENIVLPDERFSYQSEPQLNASLVSRQHELITSLQAKTNTLEALEDRLNQIPKIELHSHYLVEQKTQFARLSKGVTDADKYQGLLDSYEKCVEDQKQIHIRLNRLIEVAESTDIFLQTKSHLFELTTIQKTLSEERTKDNIHRGNLENKLSELRHELKTADSRALLLRDLISNSGSVYTELSNYRERFSVLSQQIIDKEITIKVEQAKLEKINLELSDVSALNITSNLLLTGNLGSLVFAQEKIKKLAKCHADLDLVEVHNQALHSTQKALTEQMEIHERLISIGLDYLSIEPSDTCPLCSTHHSSAEVLLDKVKNQNLLSDLSKENSKKLSLSSKHQKELRDKIQVITQQVVESQALQLRYMRQKQYEVGEVLTKADKEKSTLEAEYKTLEIRKVELDNLVWGLSNDELVSRVEAELSQLYIMQANIIKQQESLTTQIQSVTELINDKDSKLKALGFEMNSKINDYAYVSVMEYLNANAIVASDIKKHCEMKRREFDADALRYRIAIESLIAQSNDLKQEMIADRTWVDFVQLKRQKADLEVSLTCSQSVVNAFYESLSNVISVCPEYTLEKVKALIIFGIDEYQLSVDKLNKLSSNIKLLLDLMVSFKPYIKHISLQEELTAVELQLKQRNRVDVALIAERDSIINNLKKLINNFFYEDLINSIYRKIDPHPTFKKVEFKADFDSDKPGLNIVVSDGAGGMISPILYFSAAQTNILSLSVFLASALHAKDDKGDPIDVILIDDPIQSMDSINILSTIDLLRSICLQFKKQLIISTHDENFFGLLQRKIPAQIFGSKFLQLERFGVVSPVEPFLN
ncbi:AAA family ATPase [Photobacterium phosphoreum]|uniref:AAA family ATPase n=1 Tax=Photobacterium phosphoreum TaxID=659 RepID=UPI0024B79E83|nr:AAA family ATPase [Photobacterium phosphoreum]